MARLAAAAYSLTSVLISSIVIIRGGVAEYSVPSRAFPLIGTVVDETASTPSSKLGTVALPTCHSWQYMKAPLACTASVTFFQPVI